MGYELGIYTGMRDFIYGKHREESFFSGIFLSEVCIVLGSEAILRSGLYALALFLESWR